MKRYISLFVAAFLGSIVTLSGYQFFFVSKSANNHSFVSYAPNSRFASYANGSEAGVDFVAAAEKSVLAVVHIKSTIIVQQQGYYNPIPDPFRDFFGDDFFGYGQPKTQRSESSGSGVIVSYDGYIVTNNHVVKDAEEVEVILDDQRSYKAKVVGTDPSTDIALLKIEETELPFINFANSNDVKVGEWVLAVGNPFNLASTVTAGIVSAKGRSINILQDRTAIESFIQTDAAVNPGNSGGALVNTRGELIGINTAIATPTGVYAGYSFAVPSNIVAKVVADIKEFGIVQRGYLGVVVSKINGDRAKELGLSQSNGVYVDSLARNSAAETAGIKVGDIITKIEDLKIKTVPDLTGEVGSHRPGDKINVTVVRGGKEMSMLVTLKNKEGKLDVVKKSDIQVVDIMGVELEQVTDKNILRKLGLSKAVKISKVKQGKISAQTNVREGLIILKINGKLVQTPEDVNAILSNTKGGVMMEGVYPNFPGVYYFAFGL